MFAQVVNTLMAKVKDIVIFAVNISIFFSRSWIGLPSQFCVCNSHKLWKLAQGKFSVGHGKHREFEWVPCKVQKYKVYVSVKVSRLA